MTLIKMRIGMRTGSPHYAYPPQYDANKVKYGPIYESGLEENAVAARQRYTNGVGYEEILIGVDDGDAARFLAANGTTLTMDGVAVPITAEVVTREKAITDCKHFMGEPKERITDQAKVISILAKLARKEALTVEEQKALDPNDKTPGIGRTKSFEETLDEFFAGK